MILTRNSVNGVTAGVKLDNRSSLPLSSDFDPEKGAEAACVRVAIDSQIVDPGCDVSRAVRKGVLCRSVDSPEGVQMAYIVPEVLKKQKSTSSCPLGF